MPWNPNYKHCNVCHIEYDGDECPSCNPRTLYYPNKLIPNGEDDFEFEQCECCEKCCEGYWRLSDAKAHAKEFDGVVLNQQGEEIL